MDFEDRKLLKEALQLSRENNKLLKKMHRAAVLSSVFRALYWIIIIGLALGSYYIIQPYIEVLKGVYDNLQSSVDTIQNVGNQLPDLSKLFTLFGVGE